MSKKNLWVLFCLVAGQLSFSEERVISLGEMDGFYRYTAVLGPLLAEGHRLREIPQWMLETDFPYKRRPYGKEAPFTDGMTVVRLLGGWENRQFPEDRRNDPNDLVYRDEEGTLHYRWHLLKARLDPYIQHGYTDLTLVLDNVPWCLPAEPVAGGFGQVAPPGDYMEWYHFIRDLCRELKRLYGEETVSQFRFRMGTEMQDHRRFSGSFEEYLKYYDFAARAVKEEIPEAGFGPFNRSMPMAADQKKELPYDLIDILDVVRHCATGTNYATGEIGSPIDFLARSFYYFSSQPRDGVFANIHPDQRTPEQGNLWREARAIHPSMATLSREVHELGPHLNTEEGLYGLDTGARGAAQTLHTLVNFKEEGADRLWHWELFEDIAADKALLLSQGWLYSVMDHMRGGDLYSVPVRAQTTHENTHKALLSVKADQAILLVATWHVDRVRKQPDRLEVNLPRTVLRREISRIQSVALDEESSVYDVIRKDLKEAGLLSERHLAHRGDPATLAVTGGYHVMASDRWEGRRFIEGNWEKYSRLMRDSLRLHPFAGTVSTESRAATVSWQARNPSVTVLVLDF